MKNGLKGLVMLALAYFLFSRITNGTLFFYINNRFAWLTFLAVIGFFAVALGYLYQARLVREMLDGNEARRLGAPGSTSEEHHLNTRSSHAHGRTEHAHHHDHGLSRAGLVLVMLPVVLGLLVPARPLGAAAVGNREVSVGRLSTAAAPRASQVAAPTRAKNLLDWLMAFDQAQDPAAFDGQPANLLGFVYRDSRFGEDSFLLSRFVVSCCVADATPIGLVVRTPAASQLALDQWVQVSGRFQAGAFDGHPMPILVADVITPTVAPNQPYLFP